MVKLSPTLANLGFLLQISGFFTLLPIAYAFYISETNAAIGLLIAAIVLLCLGFILNALCERKNLNLRQSFALLVLFYVVVTLINTIPYLYVQIFQGNILEQFLNSWFETMSASSTSGLTLMEGMTVPQSMMLARGLNEWIGGMGIVFILLSTFYPSEKLDEYSKALGFERLASTYKGTFFIVMIIYVTYTLIFWALLMITGLDAFIAFHTVLTVFSTTGLTIISASSMPVASVVVITFMMLASAFSFVFHFKLLTFIAKIEWKQLFRRKWRSFLMSVKSIDWKSLLSFELKLYLALLAFLTLALWGVSGINPFQSFYHIVDFSSSCGLGVVNFQEINEAGKIILLATMFIGPMSFSIGGGIRVIRAYILGKSLATLPKTFLTGKIPKIKIEREELQLRGIYIHLLIIALFAIVSFAGAWILSNYSYNFGDAMLESVSAITTTGDSPKVLTPALPVIPKMLLIFLHLAGRIEIIPLMMFFSRERATEWECYQVV
jgi:trk system potassium uptake protein TrkH